MKATVESNNLFKLIAKYSNEVNERFNRPDVAAVVACLERTIYENGALHESKFIDTDKWREWRRSSGGGSARNHAN